jgi:cyclohexa-1,5-dienecarbonyl-CoA hydratase
MTSTISLELLPKVARITLNHPPLNVITLQMTDELAQSIAEADRRPEISTVLIQGNGGSFSAGVSVAIHTPQHVPTMLEKFHAIIRAVVTSQKVFVAAVRGNCLGGGAELAMVCDLVYTTKSAKWGFPEITLGCYPPVACTALAALIGPKRAAELVLTGRHITGREAANIGLANLALADYKLNVTVENILKQISTMSPSSLALTKKASYGWDAMHFDKGLARAEKIYLEELMKTDDAQEGVAAFLAKRSPVWKAK